jgi:metallo-beta-lactamase family protein
MISITFLGAARTVTGSKYLIECNGTRVFVDAGLFQGLKELRERNWQDLPIAASSIDAVVLTHAHLDHCGYLPRLVQQGFRGRVFCTLGTQDLCKIVLPDSGRIQEEDAAFANRHGFSKHKPALPLYGESDAFRAVSQLQPGSKSSSSTRDTCSAPRTCACASTDVRSCSAAIWGASTGRSCRIQPW